MPRLKGSADLLEDRRRRALTLLDEGLSLNTRAAIFSHAATVPGAYARVSAMRSAAGGLLDKSEDLIGGQRDDAEHQMAHPLCVASHPSRPTAEFVLQARVHPLHRCTFPITDVLGVVVIQQLAPVRFGL